MLTINEVEKDWVAAIGTSDINERKNIAERWNAYYSYLAANQADAAYTPDHGTENIVEFMLREGIIKYGDKIIDIGSGSGRYSIELAKHHTAVTALDANEDSLELLKKHAWQAHVTEINCIPIHWEDFNTDSRAKKYDVSFSSMCPAICTLEELARMEKITKRTACLISASRGSYEKHRREIMRLLDVKPRGMTTESIYYYNVLYLSGRSPSVKTWSVSGDYSISHETFIERYLIYLKLFDVSEQTAAPVLEKYFAENSQCGLLTEECRMNMAMIWWNVPCDEH